MLRHRWASLALAAALVAAGTLGCGSDDKNPAGTTAVPQTHSTPSVTVSAALGRQLTDAHAATAKYATDLSAAERDGYMIITQMMPGMGFHYLNPNIKGFDASKPAILVYLKKGAAAQLVALEWVFPEQPTSPPLDGATYGSFDAACHFKDGTFTPVAVEANCPQKNPDTASPFNFWHPKLVTMHVWLWYPNPAGLYHGTNPLVEPFTA